MCPCTVGQAPGWYSTAPALPDISLHPANSRLRHRVPPISSVVLFLVPHALALLLIFPKCRHCPQTDCPVFESLPSEPRPFPTDLLSPFYEPARTAFAPVRCVCVVPPAA